jgi:creatinine amidohydrolase
MIRSFRGLQTLVCGILVSSLFVTATAWGQQVPKMRTRRLTSLTNDEVEEYLKRNNIVIIPVGPTEMHGALPLEGEYVFALGYALKMAEEIDALVFPHFAYDYPGGTLIGHGTFHLSVMDSSDLLKKICYSLVRQGFGRIMFTSSHGPASNTIYPVVREIYEEKKVPLMDTAALLNQARAKVTAAGGKTDKTTYGLYEIAGQLSDIPLGVTAPAGSRGGQSAGMATQAGGGRGRGGDTPMAMGMGNFYTDPEQHSWYPDKPLTEALRAEYAREGVAQVEAIVKAMDMKAALRAMDKLETTAKEVIKKYGSVVDVK